MNYKIDFQKENAMFIYKHYWELNQYDAVLYVSL